MLYNLLHLRQLSIVVRHVGSQDQIDGSLSEVSVFLSAQLVHELAIFIIENSKHLRCVETFLGRYIIAVNGSTWDGINMVTICVSIMAQIVTDACDQHGKSV